MIIYERNLFGKHFRIYGTKENPLFLAKDVAEWIDYAKTGQGYYDVSSMLSTVDSGEKIKTISTNNSRSSWFLTENGLYEVLMQSRKPIAKELKKEVIANRWAYSYRLLKERPVVIETQSINDNTIEIIDQRVVLNKEFRIYGTKENPLFLAKDVAEWIEHSNVSVMLDKVDNEEKELIQIGTLNNAYSAWFLTEDGLYEVLMQSRKPIAKEFKKEVKKILKQIRQTGGYIPVKDKEEIKKCGF